MHLSKLTELYIRKNASYMQLLKPLFRHKIMQTLDKDLNILQIEGTILLKGLEGKDTDINNFDHEWCL